MITKTVMLNNVTGLNDSIITLLIMEYSSIWLKVILEVFYELENKF